MRAMPSLPRGLYEELITEALEATLQQVIDVDERREVRPGQLSPQRGDNLFIRKRRGEPDHGEEISLSKPSPKLRLQLCSQRVHNLLPVLGPPFPQDVVV